ncbi:MAG: DNA glycosylase AlkZ-like family protein [Acidimicrobiales bacterium]
MAEFVDAPQKDVKAHWPDDAVEVRVDGERDARYALSDDVDDIAADHAAGAVRLVGPYDGYLQLRDRALLVADEAQRKDLWRVLGRPGAIVVGGEVAGTWRPRSSGRKLTLVIDPGRRLRAPERAAVDEQAELLAARRGGKLARVEARTGLHRHVDPGDRARHAAAGRHL